MAARRTRWIPLFLLVVGVWVWPPPVSAVLVSVTADTSALAGTAAQLEFDLFGLDDLDGNNTALLTGPAVGAPVLLTDAGGLGQLLQDTVLGTSVAFTVDLSSVFEAGSAEPDRFAFFLLDPVASLSLVATDLEGDALLRADLVGGALAVFAAAVTTPAVPVQAQVQAVPGAGSLLLVALGLALLRLLWPGGHARRRSALGERTHAGSPSSRSLTRWRNPMITTRWTSRLKRAGAAVMALLILVPAGPAAWAANHREAPITALDHKADITDFFAFASYDRPESVTFILDVDPLLKPANGPNYFPFDPEILYAIRIDNDHDAREDVTFEFRFKSEIRAPQVFTSFVGAGTGVLAPDNSPDPVAPGTLVIPPAITALDGPGSEGIVLRQSYTVTMVRGRGAGAQRIDLTGATSRFAVPSNVGSRTMPNYAGLAKQGIYSLANGVRVFAGTVDDPFWIDLGGTFDTLNLRSTVAPGVLSAEQDAANQNVAPDHVSGFNVNAIAIEVPIALLTQDGQIHRADDPLATIGAWGTTSRPRTKVLPSRPGGQPTLSQNVAQIQRMGNPLVNELLIGTGFKDMFSMSQPKDDAQFASFVLDPLLARVVNAATGGALAIPAPPRLDLLPLVQYAAPICGGSCTAGPVADLLRLNTGVPATPAESRSRLGLLAGDGAGFPNGRRVFDDVTDLALRVVVGGVLAAPFPGFDPALGGRLGDGVNINDVPYQETFPYVGWAQSGRDSRHIDPGEAGCSAGAGPDCPIF